MRDTRLGLALGGGGSDEPSPFLASSFISFFHETYVVSPCLSSTLSNFRSPAVKTFGEGFDDSPGGVEPSSVVAVAFGGSSIWWFGSGSELGRVGDPDRRRREENQERKKIGLWRESRERLELRGGILLERCAGRFPFFLSFFYFYFIYYFYFNFWKGNKKILARKLWSSGLWVSLIGLEPFLQTNGISDVGHRPSSQHPKKKEFPEFFNVLLNIYFNLFSM